MSEGEVKSGPQWARLIKRLLNPPFGTDTSERLLMGEAADAIRYLLERVSPVSEALITEVTEWRGCALYDPTMEGPRFKGWDRSALERCRATAEKAGAVPLPPRDCAVDAQTSLASLTTQLEAERERATKAEERCEAYKGQVEAGAKEIGRLTDALLRCALFQRGALKTGEPSHD